MNLQRTRVVPLLMFGFLCLSGASSRIASAEQAKRLFTVADDIELTHFGDASETIRFSPNGNYFAVWTERGRLDLNRPEDSLRIYGSQDVKNFVEHSDQFRSPAPVWVITRTAIKGFSINGWRWLADSSGVAFLERTVGGNQHLVLADLQSKTVESLTSETENVEAFDLRDRRHYVFTAPDPGELERLREKTQAERHAPAIVGTGRSLCRLLLPGDPITCQVSSPRSYLWAVVGSKRFEVKSNGAPIVPDVGLLALSPDGGSLVTKLLVPEIPSSWEMLYPPPYASDPHRIRASHQEGQSYARAVHQYVRIDLQTGSVHALTDAPISSDAGSWAYANGGPTWSNDSQEVLLPGTFIRSKDDAPSRPCVAIVNFASNTRTCVEVLKGQTETGVEEGYHIIEDARFVDGDQQRVVVTFENRDWSKGTTEYQKKADGIWQISRQTNGNPKAEHNGVEITVTQSFKEPPLLIATSKKTSQVIWDPNPQLKNIELGEASVYTWKDQEGREWKGGLYKPVKYKPGHRYPLVIQTHGFTESEFRPSGVFPAAFAARALAAAGITVLQVREHCPTGTPEEAPCAAYGYEAAAKQLVSESLIDPERIGIIGFSRTCFYVMETLTMRSYHPRAASITDGVMGEYVQYMVFGNPENFEELNSMIGAPPFGEGLEQWLKRSPGFNLDKINTPLMVVGLGPLSLLSMWQPYAGLRYMHKPVDLVMLNTDEHVLTNPAVRMASQGGSVDWFRFWLQDYEDPDPKKKEQYERWRGLRNMQEENDAKRKADNEKAAPVN